MMDRVTALQRAGIAVHGQPVMSFPDQGQTRKIADLLQQVEKETAMRCVELAVFHDAPTVAAKIRGEFKLP